jgi:hypothetical protein
MRERLITVVSEQADLIGYAGCTHSAYGQSTGDEVWKDDLVKVLAARVHDQTDSLTANGVQETSFDEPSIDCSVKPRVVNSVIHVPVDVDVFPLGINLAEPVKVGSRPRLGPCHERFLIGNQAGTAVP